MKLLGHLSARTRARKSGGYNTATGVTLRRFNSAKKFLGFTTLYLLDNFGITLPASS
jgi:hypothetical protein